MADVEPAGEAPAPGPGEPLRVLLIFSEAPGSRPLAMRQEREVLLGLFHGVMQERNVEVEVLCHGVTAGRLREALASGSFHVLHWSGHGHGDVLELPGPEGGDGYVTGAGLVELIREAGGILPRLVFLSACLSGALVAGGREELERLLGSGPRREPRKSADVEARPERAAEAPAAPAAPAMPAVLAQRPGYTSTALALLAAGVPQVVAMRYEVGDSYARELALRFYRHLLADRVPRPADAALALARQELLREKQGEFSPVDHATPLVLGKEGLSVPVALATAGEAIAVCS